MNSKSLCPLPWLHLATHPIGEVSVCCRSDMNHSSGHAKNDNDIHRLNLNSSTVDEMRNSDTFKKIRLQMLNGEIPRACVECFQEEKRGIKSKRMKESQDYPLTQEYLSSITDVNGAIENPLRFIELRLGNVCNLKCITCNPMSSTLWKKDATVLKEKYLVDFPHDYTGCDQGLFTWPDHEKFWQEISPHRETLDRIYINGGEPTLHTRHWTYLRSLIDSGHSQNIGLLYNINLTYIPDELMQIWKRFKKVEIHVSIDDIGERNDYIRFPSKWVKIEENFKKLLSFQFEVGVVQTVSCFNFFTLNHLSDWLESISPAIHIFYNFVTAPAYFSPLIIHPEHRKKMIHRYETLSMNNQYIIFKQYFNNEYFEEGKDQFLKVVLAMDEMRKTDYRKTFAALAETLES